MNRTYLSVGILAVVLATGFAAAFFTGVGPAPGDDSGETITDFPTASGEYEYADGDSSTDDSTASGASEAPPFSFTIDEIEECGRTCRDVTVTLHNNGDEAANGITVYTRIFAGQDNTDDDDLVWEGTNDVSSLDAGASRTSTERVELSYQEGLAVDRNDGWVTVLTTVESDDVTVTFRNSVQATE